MGRVYNALVRAERWKDRDRPIGCPVGQGEEPGLRIDATAVSSSNTRPASAAPFSSEQNGSLGEAIALSVSPKQFVAVGAPGPASGVARANVPGSAAQTSAPQAFFEEPSEVSNVRDLSQDLHLAALNREDSLAVEQYQTLTGRLLNFAHRRKLKTLLITSAEAGEGKTTVAINVAWLLARERRVLLIDSRLDSPSVSRVLGIDAKRGWLDLSDGSCELKDAITRLDPNRLYAMAPGSTTAKQAAETLSLRLENVIAEVSPRFDFVVVDSAPILESAETQRFAEILDGAVIVALAGQTHRSQVTAARKLVPKERRLGLLLNESEVSHDGRQGKHLLSRLFGRKR